MNRVQDLLDLHPSTEFPDFRAGDTVRVDLRIIEGESERIQPFEGVVLRKKYPHTFTLRKVSYGVGVERIFPFCLPLIKKIKVIKHGKVRRSRLYYLRLQKGKAARVREA